VFFFLQLYETNLAEEKRRYLNNLNTVKRQFIYTKNNIKKDIYIQMTMSKRVIGGIFQK
jgi:uncharacterized iron-regulated protein